jgi:hypothetical protein
VAPRKVKSYGVDSTGKLHKYAIASVVLTMRLGNFASSCDFARRLAAGGVKIE